MSSSRFDTKKNLWSCWAFCACIAVLLNSGLGFAFTSNSHSWSHHPLVQKDHWLVKQRTPITIDADHAFLMTNKAPIPSALTSNHGNARRRKPYGALFMVNENFTNEQQVDVDSTIRNYGTIQKERNTDTDAIVSYDYENESDNNADYWLPGSKTLATFFALPIVDVGQASLVILASFLVALGTLQQIPEQACNTISTTEDLIGWTFFLDFFFRWYSNGFKREYLLNPFSIIDAVFIFPVLLQAMPSLAAMLPALSSSSGLINLRLLRILRLQLVLSDLETFGNFEIALGLKPSDIRPYQLQLARVILSIFTLTSVSAGLIYTSEHTANPEAFPDYFTALYFCLTTLTTVGFGDIVPITFDGRLVVSGSILAGVAIVPIQAAALFEALLDFQKERQQDKEDVLDQERNELERIDAVVAETTDPLPLFASFDVVNATTGITNGNYYAPQQRGCFIDCLCKTCRAESHRRDAFFCWRCGAELTSSDGNDFD